MGERESGARDDAGPGDRGVASFARHQAVLATLLTALAGFLDAVGYIHLDHLYVSFMSGNSTHLGVALATMAWSDAAGAGVIIAAFVVGTSIGAALGDATADRLVPIAVLGGELLIFVVAILLATGGHDWPALTLVALAMGMQNTLHQIVAGADIGRGFISGALFDLGQSLARVSRDRSAIARAFENALSWLAFIAGAVAGTLVLGAIGLVASLAAIAAALVLTIVAIRTGLL